MSNTSRKSLTQEQTPSLNLLADKNYSFYNTINTVLPVAHTTRPNKSNLRMERDEKSKQFPASHAKEVDVLYERRVLKNAYRKVAERQQILGSKFCE